MKQPREPQGSPAKADARGLFGCLPCSDASKAILSRPDLASSAVLDICISVQIYL